MVVSELPHDCQREAQPSGTLLHAVDRPQQPLDTPHASTSPQNKRQDRLVAV
jgi:hypothetical protein